MSHIKKFLERNLERQFAFFLVAVVLIACFSMATLSTRASNILITTQFGAQVNLVLYAAGRELEWASARHPGAPSRVDLSALFAAAPALEAVLYFPDDASEPLRRGPHGESDIVLGREVLALPDPLQVPFPNSSSFGLGWKHRISGGTLIAVFSKEHLERYSNRLNTAHLQLSALLALMSCLLGLFMARLILKPVDRFIATMHAIASGEDVRVEEGLERSILGHWMKAFNEMLRQMRQKEQIERLLLSREKRDLVSHLSSGLAHRIRNPLASINSLTQLMTSKTSEEKLNEYRQVILERVQELDEAVKQFIHYARPTPLRFEFTDVKDTLSLACTLIAHDEAARGNPIELSLPETPLPRLLLDPIQLQLALQAVLMHSASTLDHGQPICVSAQEREDGGGIVLTIADEGTPVPPELRTSAFEPFVDMTNQIRGVELPLAAKLLEAQGGSIRLEGGEERGNRYVIELPELSQEEAQRLAEVNANA